MVERRGCMKKNMRLDDRIASYRSFLDYRWVKEFEKLLPGTVLHEPTFVLLFSWKATANAYTMPFLMMQMLKNLEQGYLRKVPGITDYAVQRLATALPQRMGQEHGLS